MLIFFHPRVLCWWTRTLHRDWPTVCLSALRLACRIIFIFKFWRRFILYAAWHSNCHPCQTARTRSPSTPETARSHPFPLLEVISRVQLDSQFCSLPFFHCWLVWLRALLHSPLLLRSTLNPPAASVCCVCRSVLTNTLSCGICPPFWMCASLMHDLGS